MNMQTKISSHSDAVDSSGHQSSNQQQGGSPINDLFKERIEKALGDAELRANFRGAMEFLTTRRAAILPNRDDFEALRGRGQQIRNSSLQNLPELLEQFDARCTENGIKVHWAETAERSPSPVAFASGCHSATTTASTSRDRSSAGAATTMPPA